MKKFQNFRQIELFLENLNIFHMDLSLDRVKKALKILHLESSLKCSIQIVGTNGKGSTATFLEALARAHQLKTGLFTSPHLVDVKERIKVNNQKLSEKDWLEAFNHIYHFCKNIGLTYFEYLFILSCYLFKQHQVDIAIFEAGLGGRYDATSSLDHNFLLFTTIDLDHCSVLGNSLNSIAKDKAEAIKPKQIIISTDQTQEVLTILKQKAKKEQAIFLKSSSFVQEQQNNFFFPSTSTLLSTSFYLQSFQKQNLVLALAAWDKLRTFFNIPFNPPKIKAGLNNFFQPGRLQKVNSNPDIYLDVAHNPSGIKHLRESLQKLKIFPQTVIFSCLKDKDIEGIVTELKALNAPIYFYELKLPHRNLTYNELKLSFPKIKQLTNLKEITSYPSPLLVCGSFYLLAQVYKLFPSWLDKNLLNPQKIF